MGRLDGKVAIISGGARGQGAAEARMFVREGAKVVFGDILDEEGMKTEAEIRELGGEATFVHLDVTQEEDWRKAVQVAENTYGRLDVLVNNAGITLKGSIEEITEEQWDNVMNVNAKGPVPGHQTLHPRHAPRWRRLDHQHVLHVGYRSDGREHRRLQRQQRGRAPVHQGHGYPTCQGQHTVQLCPSRPGEHTGVA